MSNTLDFIERELGENPSYSIIWLHGLGADGHDFEPIVPELNLPPGIAVRFIFPHAPQQPVTVNWGMVMRAWYDIKSIDIARTVDEAGVEQSAAAIRALIEREIARGIPSARIILAGFSQGGAVALHTGLQYPATLAGLIGLSTYLPLPDHLHGESLQANRNTPLFMAHGSYDPVVPVTLGDQTHQRLQELGYRVEWHTYPMEHAVNLDEIRDLGAWLRLRLTD